MNIKKIDYEFIENADFIREVIYEHFDIDFWECELGEGIIESYFRDSEYILFSIKEQPCALVKMSHYGERESLEIEMFDVENSKVGRYNGVGTDIVTLLKQDIYFDRNLYGYSTPSASKFWIKNCTWYDERIYEKFKFNAFIKGGLMEFRL